MAVKLRLRRMGKKKQPIYKIVAADSRSPRDGKFLEAVGLYNPLTEPHTIDLKEDRIEYWLGVGAQPTDTVRSLLRQKGITLKNELKRKGLAEDKIEAELENWEKKREEGAKAKADKKKKKELAAKEKAKEEETKEEDPKEVDVKTEEPKSEPVTDSSEEEKPKQEDIEESAAEVKGATSEEEEKTEEK